MITFASFAARKAREARAARINPLRTVQDRSGDYALEEIGNGWTRALYDGPFHLSPVPAGDLPAVSLVFVQSRDGNTVARNPAHLGGGDADKHLLYEGLSRVASDGVLSGATTASGAGTFSIWHPELVALRLALGRSRHPAQIIVTGRGCVDVPTSLICNVPEIPTFILGSETACTAIAEGVRSRPWIRVIPIENTGLRVALARLRRDHGIDRISAIGGPMTATALVDEGLVQDLYLTTTAIEAGEPDTPWYVGENHPVLETVVTKRGNDPEIVFEHLRVGAPAVR